MASTRFNNDDSRIRKRLQESTDPGKWVLGAPGNGVDNPWVEDPHIRMQTWGGLWDERKWDLEAELRGQFPQPVKDCILQKHEFMQPVYCADAVRARSKPGVTPRDFGTDESRATHPAWSYRGIAKNRECPWLDESFQTLRHTIPCVTQVDTRRQLKDGFVQEIKMI